MLAEDKKIHNFAAEHINRSINGILVRKHWDSLFLCYTKKNNY